MSKVKKSTKYFLNLEKRQSAKTCISKLKTHDSLEITNADEILKYQKLFYKNLYTAVPWKENKRQNCSLKTQAFLN